MRFLIISHSKHKVNKGALYGYAPYVNEMNLWLKHVSEVEVLAPEIKAPISNIETQYNHNNLIFSAVSAIEFTSVKEIINALIKLPSIIFKLFKSCKKADHIHLRCPGNMGLLGCLVQIFFPKKVKTAKYAGNWDPKAKQPISYNIQKWLLSNTLLTKNITVLVYGNWKNQTKNIKPFFTATYKNSERQNIKARNYTGKLNFLFVGSLVKGKRPLFAIQIIEKLNELGYYATLDMYGDGVLKPYLIHYIKEKKLKSQVTIFGNQKSDIVKETLQNAHFLILASQSEGWPKAIAEAMFFGTIPISTNVSCIPYMLDYGRRGILIPFNLNDALQTITKTLKNTEGLSFMANHASEWSQNYTLDVFEAELIKILKT